MKTTTNSQLTPDQFIAFVKLMGCNPNVAVKALMPKSWPSFKEVSIRAEELADELECSDRNIAKHAFLFALSNWCQKRIA